ncbi:MAG: hypothetical protein COT21_00875 [Hadesarchaea archaeon CG08_land_8_20_14_0_20_51_8]|nr:MAG: hypothetical protein COT21_00875 [Hadesarchaea archaeon CG08_land_8_20_14_0_20_51_8]
MILPQQSSSNSAVCNSSGGWIKCQNWGGYISMEIERIFSSIDQIIEKVNPLRREPEFSEEIKERMKRTPNVIRNDDDVLRRLARLIAFSQNTRSDLISNMLNKGIFERIFHGFQVDRVAQLDPDELKNLHWEEIKAIRFPRKLESIVYCAKTLQLIKSKYGSFLNLLKTSKIPTILKEESDIENFWQGFNYLKKELINMDMPFLVTRQVYYISFCISGTIV